jgi:hypothetical protein
MMLRRSFLFGLGSMLAAPAIVHAHNIMPVKALSMRSIAEFAGLEEITSLDILYGQVTIRSEWLVRPPL